MEMFWTIVTLAIVFGIGAIAVWVFVVAPIIVPGRGARAARRS